MKSIAGSIIVFGACVLMAVGVAVEGDRAMVAKVVAGVLIVLGLILAFTGSKDERRTPA